MRLNLRKLAKSPLHRKVARLAYYARNIARDLAPPALFRRRLDAVLARIEDFDRAAYRRG